VTDGAAAIDRVALFAADIEAAPDALAALLDAWRPVDPGGRSRLVFTGLGSSRYAALLAAAAIRARGGLAWVEHASTVVPTPRGDEVGLVAISASGRTPEVVAAAERHHGTSHVVAVTNDPGSALASAADVVVPLHAGEERSGIASRTFRATVAALAMLTGDASPDDLRASVETLAARIGGRSRWVEPMADAMDGAPSVDVLAETSLLGLAEQSALMFREAPRLSARAHETGEWLHTGVYLALPGHRAVLFEGSPADAEVVATIERRGGEVGRFADPGTGPIPRAIVDSVVSELCAAELWRRADATG
jgi:fructoselysine-6-P-deglycase FrlB-like protein